MTTGKTKLLTADDLLRLYSQGVRGELVRGIFCKTTVGGMEKGVIIANFAVWLGNFVRPRKSGSLTAGAGFWLERDPDTVRKASVAFMSTERLPLNVRVPGYAEMAPDLVVEILSLGDTVRSLYDKARMWLTHGVTVVWVVYPESRTIEVHQSSVPVITLTEDDTLEGSPVLPGFTLPVRDVFELE